MERLAKGIGANCRAVRIARPILFADLNQQKELVLPKILLVYFKLFFDEL
jgi:hypothetical protein